MVAFFLLMKGFFFPIVKVGWQKFKEIGHRRVIPGLCVFFNLIPSCCAPYSSILACNSLRPSVFQALNR